MVLKIDGMAGDLTGEATLAKMALLKEMMSRHPGGTTCILQLELKEMNKVVDLQVNEPRGIELSKELFDQIGTVIDQPKMTLL